MFSKTLVVFLAFAVASSFATIVKLCETGGGGTADLNFVNVQDCADAVDGRCQFVKGREYSVVVNVNANANSLATALPYTAKAMILGVPVTLFEGNACEFLNIGDCPTVAGEVIEFEKVITITNTYPALQSVLTVEVKDQGGKRLLCALINFAIVNA